MFHIDERLTNRIKSQGIQIPDDVCYKLASLCPVDSALILAHCEHRGDNQSPYNDRVESNGDLIVLIVRNHKPYTIMFRRTGQPDDNLRVDYIEDVSAYVKDYIYIV